MTQISVNTFPPLISGVSSDTHGIKQLFGDFVLASCNIGKSTDDPFFNPTTAINKTFTGFAHDGTKYLNGVQQTITTPGSWTVTNNPTGTSPYLNTYSLVDGRVLFIEDYNPSTKNNSFATINPYDTGGITYYKDSNGNVKNLVNPRGSNYKIVGNTSTGAPILIGGDNYVNGVSSLNKITYIESFDPIQNYWFNFQSTLPQQIDKFDAISLNNGGILIGGGFLGNTTNPNTKCYVFNPSSDTITTLDININRYNFRFLNLSDTEVLIIGGIDCVSNTNSTTQILKINLLDKTISSYNFQALADSIYNFSIVDIGAEAFIFGGQKASDNSYLNKIYLFIKASGTLSLLSSTLSTPLANTGAVYSSVDNFIYLFGGNTTGDTEVNSIIKFDINSPYTVTSYTPSLPFNRSKISVILTNNTFYVSGSNSTNPIYSIYSLNYNPSGNPTFIYASWYNENSSDYRGLSKSFPDYALVIATDAGLSIYDQTDKLSTWMNFLRGDLLAYTHHFDSSKLIGFFVGRITYNAGVVSVLMLPDPSNLDVQTGVIINIDFVRDSIYIDVPYIESNTLYAVSGYMDPNYVLYAITGPYVVAGYMDPNYASSGISSSYLTFGYVDPTYIY